MPNSTYLSVEEAARKYAVEEKVLTQLIAAGMIETHETPTGDVFVVAEKNGNSQKPQTKEEIISENFAHLRGHIITPYRAQKKYSGIHRNNFINWARSGYIEILKEKDRLIELDEADVAYCAYVYGLKKSEYGGKLGGVRLFDENGNPYQVKYPDLSAKRRRE
jgi:hypothetical protein